MTIYDYIVLALVGAALICAVIYMVKRRKKNGGCSCGCGSCPYSDSCQKRPKDNGTGDTGDKTSKK